ncbi:MAG: response regulator [Bacteroidales bacterium]|nr:response regulator [Bacteroidales bacterium]
MEGLTKKRVVGWIDRYLADSRLEPEALLRKRWAWTWMVVTFAGTLFACLVNFLVLKLHPLWWCGSTMILVFLLGFIIYRRAKRFDLVINVIFSFFILLGFLAMVQTGGLRTSMGFIYIGINCMIVSALAGNQRWTIGMFLFYCLTIALLGMFQPHLQTPKYITTRVNTISFVYTAAWSNASMVLLLILYMKDKSRYEKAESERLRKLDDAKTMLYTNVSHEFRTPLTVIQGIAERMEQDPKKKWGGKDPLIIKRQSRILLHLVDQMLNISKLEAGVIHVRMIQGDIHKYVQHVAGYFQSLAESKGIDFKVHMDQDKPLYTDYDPEKLMHVLTNLISNAVKYTSSGGIIVIGICSEKEKRQEMVKIHIKDSGRGIPRVALGRIFDRFFQAPDHDETSSGSGLGLALTRQLVFLMKGNIHVASEEGRGSAFTVSLPVSRNAHLEEDHGISMIDTSNLDSIIRDNPSDKINKLHPAMDPDKPILLIVEDNFDLIELLVASLEDQYMIKLASNGKAGIEKAVEIIPDIMLADIMMPQMDGYQMLRHLKNDIRTDHIPVVVLTARGDFHSKITGLQLGVDHYLVKPFSQQELFLTMKNLLEARRKMQQQLGTLPLTCRREKVHYRRELGFLARIHALLDKNLHDEFFGIKEICHSIHMSRPQMYRKFGAITNQPLGQYIKSYRLQKAKIMIEEQGKNVTEAAFEAGFKNLSHFSSSFRDEFGYSPSSLL